MEKHRNGYLDYVKGILMVLIVYGHCANCVWGSYNQLPYKLIVGTFCMPGFMLVSGYLLYHSCQKKEVVDILKSRTTGILLPCTIWELPLILLFGSADIWYLHSAFICSVLLICIVKSIHVNDGLLNIIIVATVVLVSLIPSDYAYLSWMFPFLTMGYFIGKYQKKLKSVFFKDDLHTVVTIGVGILGYIILMCFYKDEWSAYNYGTSLLLHRKGVYHGMRFLTHSFASFVAGCSIYVLYKCKLLTRMFEKIGKASMLIYIFHGHYIQLIIYKLSRVFNVAVRFADQKWIFDYFVSFVVMIFMIVISLLLEKIIKKNKVLSLLLIGGR